jgi:hypothetical protein
MMKIIEINLADILNKIDQRLDRIEQGVNDLKISVVRLQEKTEALDGEIDAQGKILEAKIDGLDQRIGNQEFINRSVLAALIPYAFDPAPSSNNPHNGSPHDRR